MEKPGLAPQGRERGGMVSMEMQVKPYALRPKETLRNRYSILAILFVNVVINYMDRSNIAIAAPLMSGSLHLTSIQLGFIFSAFSWTYACFQIPGGILADRVSPRILYFLCITLWSLATFAQGFVSGFILLFLLRMTIGLFEAPSYPVNNKIVSRWFNQRERATAIAVYTSGQYIGLAFLAPLLTAIEHLAGWKGLFFYTGIAGLLWGFCYYFLYRDHAEKTVASKDEPVTNIRPAPFRWDHLKLAFQSRKLWGIYIGQFAVNGTLWFFLTWFPTYLVKYRHFDFLRSGYLASIPFAAAFIGILSSGLLSDYMLRMGYQPGIARKLPVIAGLLLSTCIIGANFVDTTPLVILFMCIAFFGNGFASITWIFVSTLSPKDLVGTIGGVFNFFGALAGIVVPLIIGIFAQGGDFSAALVFVSILGLLGSLSYIFLVGKIKVAN